MEVEESLFKALCACAVNALVKSINMANIPNRFKIKATSHK